MPSRHYPNRTASGKSKRPHFGKSHKRKPSEDREPPEELEAKFSTSDRLESGDDLEDSL